MKALKRFLKSDAGYALVSWIAAAYIWLVYRTSRWQMINHEEPFRLMDEGKPFILAFWHGRLLMMPIAVKRTRKYNVLISQHGDGEIIARTIKHWNLDSIRGSSSKGALTATKEVLKSLKRNEIAVITPDGPRGPRMRTQPGVVRIAAMSGMPVFPVSFSTTRGKVLKSWDRFFVAKPFGQGTIIWGDPISVPRHDKDGAYDAAGAEIENSLTAITQQADLMCYQPCVFPDEATDR